MREGVERAWPLGMMGLPVPSMPEPSHARPSGSLPDGGRPCRAPAAPAPGRAARAGAVGVRRHPGAERLPVGGDRRAAAARPLPRAAPAPAEMAVRRRRSGRALRHPARGRALLRAAADLGAGVVAGAARRRARCAPPAARSPTACSSSANDTYAEHSTNTSAITTADGPTGHSIYTHHDPTVHPSI